MTRPILPKWLRWRTAAKSGSGRGGAGLPSEELTPNPRPDQRMADSLRGLLGDPAIPASVRAELSGEFSRVQGMLAKLERSELHIAVFGRVSTGKSSLCNALLGREAFAVGVLHGTTTGAEHATLDEATDQGLVLIDTPGINELDGEARERIAFEVAEVCDLVFLSSMGILLETNSMHCSYWRRPSGRCCWR